MSLAGVVSVDKYPVTKDAAGKQETRSCCRGCYIKTRDANVTEKSCWKRPFNSDRGRRPSICGKVSL